MRPKHQLVLIAFTVYVPTNSGLAFVRERGLSILEEQGIRVCTKECRAEQIPKIVDAQRDEAQPVAGIVGDDLLENYVLRPIDPARGERLICNSPIGREDLAIERRIELELIVARGFRTGNLYLERCGPYKDSVFGLPTLCVLGKEGVPPTLSLGRIASYGKTFFDLPELNGKNVAIPLRYQNLGRAYLDRRGAPEARLIPFERKVEVTAAKTPGIDYAIDIVLTGATCREVGMGVLAVLYKSDGVIIGNSAAKRMVKTMQQNI